VTKRLKPSVWLVTYRPVRKCRPYTVEHLDADQPKAVVG
jgi:hypothetical protein